MPHQSYSSSLPDPIELREAEIAKIAESTEDVAAVRQHLQEIRESKVFKGSHRSGQFLVYIVEQAMHCRFDSLKERVIGIELFGRSPSYDTGEDAIVRVTASDVRRRLMQYYGENGRSSRFQISLPLGSYVPEITRRPQTAIEPLLVSHPATEQPVPAQVVLPVGESEAANAHPSNSIPAVAALPPSRRIPRFWISLVSLLVLANVCTLWIFLARTQGTQAATAYVLPWTAFLNSARVTHLITSDPNIVTVQEITGTELSVSDYANRKYIPEQAKLSPEELRLSHMVLWGDNSASAVDAPIVLRIGELAEAGPIRIDARAARGIQLSDLKSDDNFIFLGSPRSNPWTVLFNNQLDFRIIFDRTTGQEIIQNVHPRGHELSRYVPSAQGWATGQSYAIIAFVQNPDQNGQVLLLAGANGEGTEAAGKLATDLPRLSAALNQCGIQRGKVQHFELLLGLNTMAGTPNNVDIIACHILPGNVIH